MYADIGPSSLLNTKISSTLEFDDGRVDYAQINHSLPKMGAKGLGSLVNKQKDVHFLIQIYGLHRCACVYSVIIV